MKMADKQTEVHKGKIFVESIQQSLASPNTQYVKLATRELVLSSKLRNLANVTDPKRVSVVVTATVIQKAMLAAGIESTTEARACLQAIGNLAGDFAMAGAMGATTLGLGALLPLVLAAVDAYDVGNSCFKSNEGIVTHAVVGNIRSTAKTGLKTTKHGPI
jgi:hypothetical protein